MREIDEVRVEGNILTIYDTRGERHRFRMGVPEQVYDEIVTKLAGIVLGESIRTGEPMPDRAALYAEAVER